MIGKYFEEIHNLLNTVEKKEMVHIEKAAVQIAETIKYDGIIHLFGCGHSHILTEEVYYRAGGLVPINPILHEPLMLHEGALKSSELERETDYASNFIDKVDIRSEDVLIVISTSGRNPVPIDVALYGQKKESTVIGITSTKYSSSQTSRHYSGNHLYDSVNLVIDNHAPSGDAVMSHENVAEKFSPSSTVIGAAILNSILSRTIQLLAEAGYEPPIFMSGNIDGADEHNKKLIEKYKNRVSL